jgi:dolichyl-diphosphooligosaccharide--protein glycosyltransferase
MTSTTEEESLELLCPKCEGPEEVRYAVVDGQMAGPFFIPTARISGKDLDLYGLPAGSWNINGENVTRRLYGPEYDASMIARLYRNRGAGLSHYRLVYESVQETFLTHLTSPGSINIVALPVESEDMRLEFEEGIRGGIVQTPDGLIHDGIITSSVKIFEVVPGAVYTGNSTPQSRISAVVALRSVGTGLTWDYVAETVTDDSGAFKLTLPYATAEVDERTTDVFSIGPYRLLRYSASDTTLLGEIVVTEDQIRSGTLLAGQ